MFDNTKWFLAMLALHMCSGSPVEADCWWAKSSGDCTPSPMGKVASLYRFAAFFIVGVDPPDPSERVNVYLPKSLIGRIDRRAAEFGMSRSSFFGLAVTTALTRFPGFHEGLAEPRSKVHKTGRLRTEKSSTKKPSL